jgi:hypothetical protein
MRPIDEKPVQSDGKKQHYWLREDFDHLMGLLPAADHEFPGDRKSSTSLTYPKNIEGAFRELRFRGLQCDASTLMQLIEQKVVRPAGELSALEWSKEDIDAAAEWLYEHGRWGSWTHFCWVCNLRYGQCIKAYRVAVARYGLPFTLSFDPLGLVTVVEPAENPDDYAYVRFFPKGVAVEPQEASK